MCPGLLPSGKRAQGREGVHPRRPVEHGRAGRRGPRRQGLQRRQRHAQALFKDPAKAANWPAPKDDKGEWTVRDDVWVRYQREKGPLLAGPLTLGFSVYGDKHHFGPELQFGHVIGDHFGGQVLLIKTAWGGKSLYKDFRPPSSGGEVGPYYTKMLEEIRTALANLKTEFPKYDGRGYELAGFVWYQGWNDGVDPKNAVPEYEQNLVNLIKDVRKDLKAPNLPVVIGELTGPWVEAPGEWATLRKAQAAAAARPEFKGNVLFVETHDFVRQPEDSPNPGHGHHEFGNAETYFLVGDALGKGMVKLLAANQSPGNGRGQETQRTTLPESEVGVVTAAFRRPARLHRLRATSRPPPEGPLTARAWASIRRSGRWLTSRSPNFQIGLASTWITPDNSDNKDRPLAPEGTLARTWPERGPTWDSVFQTVEGGLGYWAGNHFRYGPPKFSMNATPQCYDYEVGSPGWSFFYSNEALPDDRLGIAQLSNRLLIPPDALPFQGHPNGEFLGYTWMALPFTDPTTGDPPTGDQSWTCFLSTANFKGPIAYYIPETWSKIGKLFHYPFIYGRGLDARPGIMGGGAMEINTVPRFDSLDARGEVYSKIPRLQFPVDAQGRTYLVQDVTYYSKAALSTRSRRGETAAPPARVDSTTRGMEVDTDDSHDSLRPGRQANGRRREASSTPGSSRATSGACNGSERHQSQGPVPAILQAGRRRTRRRAGRGRAGGNAVPDAGVRAGQDRAQPYTSPTTGAWSRPGPKRGPFTAKLTDGSVVTYSWYRFVDQPSFQQYEWSEAKESRSCRHSWRRSTRTGRSTAITWPRPPAASWSRSIPPCS